MIVAAASLALMASTTAGAAPSLPARTAAEPLRLVPSTTTLPKGRQTTWGLRVLDAGGAAVTRFEREQTKLMHLIVVRDDLTGYQHLHPTLGEAGRFTVRLMLPSAGRYRVVADFRTDGKRYSLTRNVSVRGTARRIPPPRPGGSATVAGFRVDLEHGELTAGTGAKLVFAVTRDSRPVATLEPYLGAYGHLVAFRARTLDYTHIHPVGRTGNRVEFHAELAKPGLHRLFLQFRTGGRVWTVPFAVDVAGRSETPETETPEQGAAPPPADPGDEEDHQHGSP